MRMVELQVKEVKQRLSGQCLGTSTFIEVGDVVKRKPPKSLFDVDMASGKTWEGEAQEWKAARGTSNEVRLVFATRCHSGVTICCLHAKIPDGYMCIRNALL